MITLDILFQDGCVLQRGKNTRLFGKGTPDEKVHVSFLQKYYEITVEADGSWVICFDELLPGGPFALTVCDKTLKVYIGDVWLISGQSNMELPMQELRYSESYEFHHTDKNLRCFTVSQIYDFTQKRDHLSDGKWIYANPASTGEFSAAGWFFGRRLVKELGVPIGLINASWGGTPIHSWMDIDTLKPYPETYEYAVKLKDQKFLQSEIHKEELRASAFEAELATKDIGLKEGWSKKDFDDSKWPTRNLEPRLASDECGVTWLRKVIELPNHWDKLPAHLFLGRINDADEVWLNGVKIGVSTSCHEARHYKITRLSRGKNVLTLRVISYRGQEMFISGKLRMLLCNGKTIDLSKDWKYKRGMDCEPYQSPPFISWKPTGTYNAMIYPLRKLNITGVLWYQGESDTADAKNYADKFILMTKSWRELFHKNFPIIATELAYYGERGGWDDLRKAQLDIAQKLSNSALIAGADLGEYNDLHPQNKRQIGERLAIAVLNLYYNKKIETPYVFIGEKVEV